MRELSYFFLFSLWLVNASAQDSTAFSGNSDVSLTNPNISNRDVAILFGVGIPSKDMKELTRNNMFGMGFGGSIYFLSNPGTWGKKNKNSMLRIGGELGYTYYGRFLTEANIGGYSGNYKTSYGIGHLNAVLRLRPAEVLPVVPFVDLFVGGNFYFSTIKENLNAIETSLGLESVDFGGTSSASFVKGIGAGISIGSRNAQKTRLVLRATYTKGRTLQYIVRNSLEFDPSRNSLSYQTGRAPVQYILVQIGVGL